MTQPKLVGGDTGEELSRIGVARSGIVLANRVAAIAGAEQVSIVARATDRDVGACLAVERVVAGIARQRVVAGRAGNGVVEFVAGAIDVAGGQDQVLDIRRQTIARPSAATKMTKSFTREA
ncbi:MAG: hypothetical protein Q8O52_00110 [Sulfuritalea sp.]|nr:hypothetical protein [Sulfuritalea sp.]